MSRIPAGAGLLETGAEEHVESCACDRCFDREQIPTHQMVKFDDRIQFLCRNCWEEFRRWFHWGSANRDSEQQLELF